MQTRQSLQKPKTIQVHNKNRDRHKMDKTKQVLTRPNKTSDMNNKLHVSTFIKTISREINRHPNKSIQQKHTVQI